MKKIVMMLLLLITKNELKNKEDNNENFLFEKIADTLINNFKLENEKINKVKLEKAIQKIFDVSIIYTEKIKNRMQEIKTPENITIVKPQKTTFIKGIANKYENFLHRMNIRYLKTIYSPNFVNYMQIYFLMLKNSGTLMTLMTLEKVLSQIYKYWPSFIFIAEKENIEKEIENSFLNDDNWSRLSQNTNKINENEEKGVEKINTLIRKTILDNFKE
jgi:hypothetical protein